MLKRLLPFALSALLLPSTLLAQDAQKSKPPAEAQPTQQTPEKKPDAFQYFFGKKRGAKEAPEAQKAPEAKKPAAVKAPEVKPEPVPAKAPEAVPEKSAEPVAPASAPVVEPVPAAPIAASEVRPEPAPVAQPQLAAPAAPAPQAAPEPPKAEEPKGDAFHYFFGQASQPVPEAKKEETVRQKPVNAFDYFFGKDGKADESEEPQSPPPV